MSEGRHRNSVGLSTSFAQQMRLLWWRGSWGALVLGLLVVLVIVLSTELRSGLGLVPGLAAAMLSLPAAALWALLIWQGELPYRRSYHWSLPVSRPGHDLARVAAGAVWLVLAYLALAAAAAIAAATAGQWAEFAAIDMGFAGWTTFFGGPVILYLVISPFALWSDSRWLKRVLIGFFGLGLLSTLASSAFEMHGYQRAMGAVFGTQGWGLGRALFVSQEEAGAGSAGGAALLWLGIGMVATALAATRRPAEVLRWLRARGRGASQSS